MRKYEVIYTTETELNNQKVIVKAEYKSDIKKTFPHYILEINTIRES